MNTKQEKQEPLIELMANDATHETIQDFLDALELHNDNQSPSSLLWVAVSNDEMKEALTNIRTYLNYVYEEEIR